MKAYAWDASLGTMLATGTRRVDAFTAVQLAASFPFKPTAHKLIVVFMTKEQVLLSLVCTEGRRDK